MMIGRCWRLLSSIEAPNGITPTGNAAPRTVVCMGRYIQLDKDVPKVRLDRIGTDSRHAPPDGWSPRPPDAVLNPDAQLIAPADPHPARLPSRMIP